MLLKKQWWNKGKIKSHILAKFGPYALKDLGITSVGTKPISIDID